MKTTILNLRFFPPRYGSVPVSIIIFSFILPQTSFGETTNKRMILPGARSQALGGAFTAVANDASAGWYNPAGLGFLRGPGMSVTVNNYSRSHKETTGVTEKSNLSENSSSLYPGFAGGNAPLGPFSFGWSYFTMEEQRTDESQTLQIGHSGDSLPFRYDRAELTTGSLIHAGGSVALALGPNLSLGVSEFYYRRQKQTALKERSTFASGVFYDSFARQSTVNEGTLTVGGIMIRGGSFSLGISGRVPKALSDKTDFETSTTTYTSGEPELSRTNSETHREDELIVRTWTLGIAWNPASWFLLSADVLNHPATKTPWPGAGGFSTKTVTDWSVGTELRADSLIFIAGAFSNKSLVETPTPSLVASEPARIDYVGFSSGLGYRTHQSETLLIMVRQKGAGKTQMVQGDLSLQNESIETQSFSLSSKYQF